MMRKLFTFKTIKSALLTKIGLVAIVPLIGISLFNYSYYRSDSISTTADIQSLINQNTATKIHLYIMAQQLTFMEYSKHSPGIKYDDTSKVVTKKLNRFLKSMQSLTLFDSLFVYSDSGEILAHVPSRKTKDPFESLVGQSFTSPVTERSYYMGPYQSIQVSNISIDGQLAVMPLIRSSSNKKLYLGGLTTLYPIYYFLQEELNIMKQKNLDEGTLLLIDRKSNTPVLEFTDQKVFPKSETWEKLSTANPVISNDKGTWYADKEDIVIGSNAYFLVTLVTKSDILFNSSRMLNVTLMIVLLSLAAMSITILLIAQGFVKPLRRIGFKLKDVATGNYSGKIDVLSKDEFGQLSESANQMTTDLKKSSQKIQRQMKTIKKERERSDNLLLNILPPSIADRLKKDESTIADQVDEATILFSDLVGFTDFSAKLSPKELVKNLNHLYSMFDDLLDRHQVEKIKTIGDALMLVSGLPEPNKNHATEMANMALDMITVLKTFNKKYNQSLNLRIGLHSGPVVAGVIGKKKFVYDLWGDTVNTASRMESHGIPGCIQLSEATYTLLKDKDYHIDKRGSIQVKGKGKMTTYIMKQNADDKWDKDYKKS